MHASQRPTELLKLIDPDRVIENYRNLSCDHYSDCLDEAVNRGWTSWTCAHCMLSVLEPDVNAVESCGAAA